MRSYLRYNASGVLTGCDTRAFGWPDHADPRDANTTDTVAKRLRALRESSNSGFTGWAPYDCSCPRQRASCSCASALIPDHYFNGVVLFPKPDLTVELDGAPYLEAEPNDFPAGATVKLVLRAAIPDNHTVVVETPSMLFTSIPGPTALVFMNGATAPINLLVPPQGVVSGVAGSSKYVKYFAAALRGWG